jgi:amyloid beta precursor protein binding protein 1
MKAQSADYIQLQNVYKTKARDDVQAVLQNVRSMENQLGRALPVDESEVEAFCKNAAHIKLVRGRPFHIVQPGQKLIWGERAKFASNALADETSLILLYIGFLAYDEFCATHAKDAQISAATLPGADDMELDADQLTGIAHRIIDDLLDEAGKRLDILEYDEVKEKAGEFCQEL